MIRFRLRSWEDHDGRWKGIPDNEPQFRETGSSGVELFFQPDQIIAVERLTKALGARASNCQPAVLLTVWHRSVAF